MVQRRETLDGGALEAALRAANLPTLLMVLYQLTGDRAWLEEPFRPTRTQALQDNTLGGFPEAVQDRIRAAAADAVRKWHAGTEPAVPRPSDEQITEMLGLCMGEPIAPEYGPMFASEMGFTGDGDGDGELGVPEGFSVAIIGAGISGIKAGMELERRGVPYTILEKNQGLGGTWYENAYPRAGVDTPSYLYSTSSHRHDWSRYFAKRDEVLAYLTRLADEGGVTPHIRYGVEVACATFDEATQVWHVDARDADGPVELRANVVICAVGLLNRPKLPDLPGMGSFRGPLFHSAQWPADLDVTGKRVAVVGTGASSMQIVPAIAPEAAHVTVVQRTAQWVAPADHYLDDVEPEAHWLFNHVPYYYEWYRARLGWTFNDKLVPSLGIDPDWSYPERSINARNDRYRHRLTNYIVDQLRDRPDLLEKAIPDYPPFGKRMLLDNEWFTTLKRDNVELVADAVSEVTEWGLRTSNGTEVHADVVVVATGFRAQQFLFPLELVGTGGRKLSEDWGFDDARAYLGVTVTGFPNLFLMYGPNTNAPGGSFFFIAECQLRYTMSLLRQMLAAGADSVECRGEVQDDYNRRVDDAHRGMIWSHPGMDTYYRNSRGRVVTQFPWRVVDYWNLTHTASLDDYVLRSAGGGAAPVRPPGR